MMDFFVHKVNDICKFYGVDNLTFKLDHCVYEAVEDPGDGYRSYLETVKAKDTSELIFFRRSLANVKVTVCERECLEGYTLEDTEDGHVWLTFGTDYTDGYYPYFVFHYTPKQR